MATKRVDSIKPGTMVGIGLAGIPKTVLMTNHATGENRMVPLPVSSLVKVERINAKSVTVTKHRAQYVKYRLPRHTQVYLVEASALPCKARMLYLDCTAISARLSFVQPVTLANFARLLLEASPVGKSESKDTDFLGAGTYRFADGTGDLRISEPPSATRLAFLNQVWEAFQRYDGHEPPVPCRSSMVGDVIELMEDGSDIPDWYVVASIGFVNVRTGQLLK